MKVFFQKLWYKINSRLSDLVIINKMKGDAMLVYSPRKDNIHLRVAPNKVIDDYGVHYLVALLNLILDPSPTGQSLRMSLEMYFRQLVINGQVPGYTYPKKEEEADVGEDLIESP